MKRRRTLRAGSGLLKMTLNHLENQENLRKQLLQVLFLTLSSPAFPVCDAFHFAAHVFATLTRALLGSTFRFPI